MSCPYFDPVEPYARDWSARAAMLPLGDSWRGICRADPEHPCAAEDEAARAQCNLGYARETCARFPRDAGPDAVRFTIARDCGTAIALYYVIERDHYPFAHGPVEYSLPSALFTVAPASDIVQRQAKAYIESYLRRKKEAPAG